MLVLKVKSFIDPENLVRFINEQIIERENILNITTGSPGHFIYYYVESNES